MAITVGGTSITFNDGTTQSSAAGPSGASGVRGQVFTANGTFTIPSGVTQLKITVIGGGGGSGGVWNNYSCGYPCSAGAGAGGAAISYLTGLTPGATLSVTIGAGGSAGGQGGNGGTGGTSSVSSGTQTITTISATGGYFSYGVTDGIGGSNAGGGSGTNGSINMNGDWGKSATANNPGLGGVSLLSGPGRVGAGANGVGGFEARLAGNAGAAGVVIFEW